MYLILVVYNEQKQMHIIYLRTDDRIIEINIALLTDGSFLHTLHNTDIHKDMSDNGEYILDYIPYRALDAYKKFLEFEVDFEWDTEIAGWFDYLGHNNSLCYPIDFWKVKLIDDRVREYHNVREPKLIRMISKDQWEKRVVDVIKHIGGSLPNDNYIAGGAALYIAGITDQYTDIDIFTCDKELTKTWLTNCIMKMSNRIVCSGNSISYKLFNDGDWKVIQVILREYKSPSEIIHGFDLGSCSILYCHEDSSILTTYKGHYCLINKVNWFEPDRSSPTYAFRLAKYHMRGFRIMLPCFDGLKTSINCFKEDIIKTALDQENKSYNKKVGICTTIEDITYYGDDSIVALSIYYIKHNILGHRELTNDTNYIHFDLSKKIIDNYTRAIDNIPIDPMSIIILALFYNVSPSLFNIPNMTSDYATMKAKWITDLSGLEWKTINPMEQSLSGTFYPEPILGDVRKFYLSSPLVYHDHTLLTMK